MSEKAKHYLYHKPNPKVKWHVQSLKLEKEKSLQRRNTIIQMVSPFKFGKRSASGSNRPISNQGVSEFEVSNFDNTTSSSEDSEQNEPRSRALKPTISVESNTLQPAI